MKLEQAGLVKPPFQAHGMPSVLLPSGSQHAALRFLNETASDICGLGLFHGPPRSGKTTIIRKFLATLPDEHAVAVINGTGMGAQELLQELLAQFGYDLGLESCAECFSMIRVFATQQAASGPAPLLVIENVDRARPRLLEMLCELAELTANGKSALKMILVSDRPLLPIVQAPAMEAISGRLTGQFLLQPLSARETTAYVHAKLEAGGARQPEAVMPAAVCKCLHEASGGWPGIIDQLAMAALSRAKRCPVSPEDVPAPPTTAGKVAQLDPAAPQLLVARAGLTLERKKLEGPRLTIGRDELCELRVVDEYCSRQHAILFRNGSATIVVDLNSRNGTYLNGRPVSKQMLVNGDIISIGDHRLKFVDPRAVRRTSLSGAGWDDTTIAKCMKDFRYALAAQLNGRTTS